MDSRKPRRVLFIGGSLNQTTILHKIALCLPEMQCSFTPFFAEGFHSILCKTGLLDHTIMCGAHRQATIQYIQDHNLLLDEGGRNGPFDLILTCTDLIVQPSLKGISNHIGARRKSLKQKALHINWWKTLGLPRLLAKTQLPGYRILMNTFVWLRPGIVHFSFVRA